MFDKHFTSRVSHPEIWGCVDGVLLFGIQKEVVEERDSVGASGVSRDRERNGVARGGY